jgi:hypothetical protein
MANPIIGVLTEEITQTRGVMASATTLINGIAERLAAAVAAALKNGATESELAPLTALEAELEANRVALATAVEANSEGGGPGPNPDIPIVGASWDEETLILTKVGAFAAYNHDAGYVFLPERGTGINIGSAVTIVSKPDADNIILAGTIGEAADGSTDIDGVVRKVPDPVFARARATPPMKAVPAPARATHRR